MEIKWDLTLRRKNEDWGGGGGGRWMPPLKLFKILKKGIYSVTLRLSVAAHPSPANILIYQKCNHDFDIAIAFWHASLAIYIWLFDLIPHFYHFSKLHNCKIIQF